MSKRPIPTVADDFAQVTSFLKERNIISAHPAASLLVNAKHIHSFTYSLILWRFRLRNLPEHSKVFVEEIASDALQILPQILMGYGKTSKLLIRGIVENALRHVYFSDHPIEFGRMNRDKKWYLSVTELCDYAKIHPLFVKTEPKFAAVAQLISLYSDLSGGVHGRSVRDLEMRSALSKIAYDDDAAKQEVEKLKRCAEAVNFILAIFHADKVRAFAAEDRRIILRSMPAHARSVWTHH
ncbi:hypothetical protein V1282_003974 [Nitrobacteraceae bacterium AZCC 2146]